MRALVLSGLLADAHPQFVQSTTVDPFAHIQSSSPTATAWGRQELFGMTLCFRDVGKTRQAWVATNQREERRVISNMANEALVVVPYADAAIQIHDQLAFAPRTTGARKT